MTRPRIVFVDDDRMVLSGLQNLLRKQRHEWEQVFVGSGEAALDELARAPADVVISDMRMPGMDGPALLARIRTAHPATVRIVLSGEAERADVLRALPAMQQFIAKPCSGTALRDAITRALRVRGAATEAIRAAIGRLEHLPVRDGAHAELLAAVTGNGVGIAEIARIVATSSALSVKVLQLANAGVFGAPAQPIVSVERATRHLGAELMRTLVVGPGYIAPLRVDDLPGMPASFLQQLRARAESRARAVADAGSAEHTAALVAEVGALVLALAEPVRYAALVVASAGDPAALQRLEAEAFAIDRFQVSAYLVGLWGLPAVIAEAVHRVRPGTHLAAVG
jgi:CheY-like chemotaxis protein/HD-like signal output (HDOD) protein